MAILFFYHHGSEGRRIFTIGKLGEKFEILKCSKQTLIPFSQQSTLATSRIYSLTGCDLVTENCKHCITMIACVVVVVVVVVGLLPKCQRVVCRRGKKLELVYV
jgi:hypothetical protein